MRPWVPGLGGVGGMGNTGETGGVSGCPGRMDCRSVGDLPSPLPRRPEACGRDPQSAAEARSLGAWEGYLPVGHPLGGVPETADADIGIRKPGTQMEWDFGASSKWARDPVPDSYGPVREGLMRRAGLGVRMAPMADSGRIARRGPSGGDKSLFAGGPGAGKRDYAGRIRVRTRKVGVSPREFLTDMMTKSLPRAA